MIHMPFIVFFTLFLTAAFVCSAWIFRRTAQLDRIDRWAFAMLPPAFLCLGALVTHKILTSIYYNLNWIRLQKSFVVAHGFPLYYGPDAGPAVNTIYPPVSILSYLPAAFFPSPMASMRIAECISISFFFLPVLWMHLGAKTPRPRPPLFALLAFLCFALLPFMVSSLRSAAFYVHVDAPTLGLAAMACAVLICARNKESFLTLGLSAVFAVLAVWSKQVAVPILAALPLYLFLAYGPRAAGRYLACLLGAGIAISGVFIAAYGYEELFFNIVTIPSRHGFRGKEGLPPLAYASYKLLKESGLLLAMGLFSFQPFFRRGALKQKWREWAREHPWSLMLLVSLFMVPTSLLGRAKIGGSSNTLCYTMYFLAIAVTLALAENFARRALVAMVGIFLAVQVPCVYYKYLFPDHKHFNFAQLAYDHIKKYPGKTYFPRLTIMHLLAEKKLYHDSMGLMDREMAGYPMSKEQLAAHLPSDFQQIAFLKGKEGDIEWLHLPEFSQIAADPELPGFFVYRRPGKRA